MKVYKYPLPLQDEIRLELPARAQLLHVGYPWRNARPSDGAFCLWALVDPDAPKIERRIRMAGTGHQITQQAERLKYISTVLVELQGLVFHFFEVLAD